MNRRQLLKIFPAIGYSLALPVLAFAAHSPLVNTLTAKQAVLASLNAVEGLASGQKNPKFGILVVGEVGLDLLLDHPDAGLLTHSSLRKASGVARSWALNRSHRPVNASRKVAMPLSAETPAPVKTTICSACCRAMTKAWGMGMCGAIEGLGFMAFSLKLKRSV